MFVCFNFPTKTVILSLDGLLVAAMALINDEGGEVSATPAALAVGWDDDALLVCS